MTILRAHFDGKVFVPDEPPDLRPGTVTLQVIELGWPNHKHHDSARRWFASNAAGGWATCPLTQCAFVRISANSKAVGAALAPSQAVTAIARMTTHERHVSWADDLAVTSAYFPATA